MIVEHLLRANSKAKLHGLGPAAPALRLSFHICKMAPSSEEVKDEG